MALDKKLHQLGGVFVESVEEYPFPTIFAYVPWRHHTEIITRCKTIDEALYYIQKTIQGDWSRNYLVERINNKEYSNACEMPNNFDCYLPAPQSQLARDVICKLCSAKGLEI